MEKPRRSEALPQNNQNNQNNQNDVIAGTIAPRSVERFGRIPLRTYDALEEDELDFGGFGLVCWFEGRANYGKNPPQLIGTLARIKDAVGWPWSDEALRSKLGSLKADGWIDFDMKQGSRAPYVIRLLKCRVNFQSTSKPPPSHFQVEPPSSLELTSKTPSNEQPSTADKQRGLEPSSLPSTPLPQRADSREHRADTEPREQRAEAEGSSKGRTTNAEGVTTLGGLGPDVEAAMERARAAQKSRP
jgi:hypothetical protein